jgi:4-amino-4-deoxy-L-arabinose transferase-like glycosyltransferase
LRRLCAALALLALVLLYLTFLGRSGLLLPDEPRYAAIGKAMSDSGDWVTPRLWGNAWFEKPPLVYWMAASFFRLGFGLEWAPRLPVALLAVGFLIFLFWWVRREYTARAAWFASIILATSAGWFAFGHVAVTDLPLSVFFSLAMLLAFREGAWSRNCAGIALGLAILAKALVPVVLFLPALWFLRRRWKDALWIFGIAAVFALPWFLVCFSRNGMPFFDDLIWKQHFARFLTPSLQHVQRFWFYIPVLLGGLFPWTPAAALLVGKDRYRDRRNAFLLAWFLFGFLFFSASMNKLPGYLLPLLPPVTILAGVRLDQMRRPGVLLAITALLAGASPALNGALPQALVSGARRAEWRLPWEAILLALAAAAAVLWMSHKGKTAIAFGIPVAIMLAAYGQFLIAGLPVLDRAVSGRRIWQDSLSRQDNPSVSNLNRSVRYSVCYYANGRIPDCPSK